MGLRSRRHQQKKVQKFIALGVFLSVALLVFQFVKQSSIRPIESLHKGDKVPKSLVYVSAESEPINILAAAKERPVVLVYYQSSIDPHCLAHLNALNLVDSAIRKAGYQLIAVSTESAETVRNTKTDNQLTYSLVSDTDNSGAKLFGITTDSSDNFGVTPSVFVINNRGAIVFAHTDANTTQRLSTDAILGVL